MFESDVKTTIERDGCVTYSIYMRTVVSSNNRSVRRGDRDFSRVCVRASHIVFSGSDDG